MSVQKISHMETICAANRPLTAGEEIITRPFGEGNPSFFLYNRHLIRFPVGNYYNGTFLALLQFYNLDKYTIGKFGKNL